MCANCRKFESALDDAILDGIVDVRHRDSWVERYKVAGDSTARALEHTASRVGNTRVASAAMAADPHLNRLYEREYGEEL